MTTTPASPKDLGLPTKFSTWRPGQREALSHYLQCQSRALVQVVPTGVGKSLIYMAQALINPGRTVILTATKALQAQLIRDFSSIGAVEVKGRRSYPCIRGDGPTCDDAFCFLGDECEYQENGCHYFEAIKLARQRRIVVTNYYFWAVASEALGEFDRMVMDESHESPKILSDLLGARLNLENYSVGLAEEVKPPVSRTSSGWYSWVQHYQPQVDRVISGLLTTRGLSEVQRLRRLVQFRRALAAVYNIAGGETVTELLDPGVYQVDTLHVAPYGEPVFFKGIKSLLLTSATVRPKTARMLGLRELTAYEYPSCFPPDSRPVYIVPTLGLSHKNTREDLRIWHTRIDQIVRPRLDRKGIIHSVSYKRAKEIVLGSEFGHIMRPHQPGNISLVVRDFKLSKPPAVLVSPSVSTGYDFPYDECEYQIVAKIGFPDSRSAVLQERSKHDPELPFYQAIQELVQACGRGARAADDQCETIIIDDNVGWLLRSYNRLVPGWFKNAVKRVQTLPPPLPKLHRRK